MLRLKGSLLLWSHIWTKFTAEYLLFLNDVFCFNRMEHRQPITPHCGLPALSCAGVHFTGKLPFNTSVHYSVGTALQKMKYRNEILDIDRLKRMLIYCWTQIRDTLNQAINQLPKRLIMVIKVKGAHVDFVRTNLCAMITAATFIRPTCSS